jgi:hypothetical protein
MVWNVKFQIETKWNIKGSKVKGVKGQVSKIRIIKEQTLKLKTYKGETWKLSSTYVERFISSLIRDHHAHSRHVQDSSQNDPIENSRAQSQGKNIKVYLRTVWAFSRHILRSFIWYQSVLKKYDHFHYIVMTIMIK